MSKLRIKGSDDIIDAENVFCVGKIYPEHIREMSTLEGSAGTSGQIPDEPIIFLKPNTSVNSNPGLAGIPEFKGRKISDNLQNEVELVVVVGRRGTTFGVKMPTATSSAMAALGLEDCFRRFPQRAASFSWWDYRGAGYGRNAGLRIDLVLASAPLAARCTLCGIDEAPRGLERPSHHAPVVADFGS